MELHTSLKINYIRMKTTFKHGNLFPHFLVLLILAFLAFSCVPQQKLIYIQESLTDTVNVYKNSRGIRKIQPFDNIYIKIYSIDEKTASIFNTQGGYNGGIDVNLISYTVNEKGCIDFPFVGNISINNLTLEQAKLKIQDALSQYLNNVSVTLKFVRNFVTILGAVEHQGEYSYFEERISIFEALGLAGGINNFGNKSKVKLIRRENDKIAYHNIDLTDRNIARSPFFYLSPNDVIIVDPIKEQYQYIKNYSLISVVLSSVTTIIAVLYYFK